MLIGEWVNRILGLFDRYVDAIESPFSIFR